MPNEDSENSKKKRGRKTKEQKKTNEIKIPKKRGRKPKGGKIINTAFSNEVVTIPEPNIILHLRCGLSDLNNDNLNGDLPDKNLLDSYQFYNAELSYDIINDESSENYINNCDVKDEDKVCWKKIQQLAVNLHNNNISDKKSACFWCTCDFDNPPIFIPKFELENSYQCYGCFCSPECAVAHLFKENIDSATMFERYHLLNHLYCKIYNYTKNVKPAPDPHYTLEKYYGNLTIQEYRKQLQNERLLLIVDKPLTRILPELHEDNDEFVLNNTSIPSANKFKLRRKPKQSKAAVLAENFNIK